jgi:hypothetical protein
VTFNHVQNRGGFATLGNEPNDHGDAVAMLVVNTGVDGTVTVWLRQRGSQFPGNSTIEASTPNLPSVQSVVDVVNP